MKINLLTQLGLVGSFLIFALFPHLAPASSPDAWSEFRQDVENKCLREFRKDLQGHRYKSIRIFVDPFGLESFGLAIIKGMQDGEATGVHYACLYDKKEKKVKELGQVGDFLDEQNWKSLDLTSLKSK